MTAILLSTNIVNAEEKKTLADAIGTDCTDKHKISPAALGCGIKKLFKKIEYRNSKGTRFGRCIRGIQKNCKFIICIRSNIN